MAFGKSNLSGEIVRKSVGEEKYGYKQGHNAHSTPAIFEFTIQNLILISVRN